jgi:hypothetical protein
MLLGLDSRATKRAAVVVVEAEVVVAAVEAQEEQAIVFSATPFSTLFGKRIILFIMLSAKR